MRAWATPAYATHITTITTSTPPVHPGPRRNKRENAGDNVHQSVGGVIHKGAGLPQLVTDNHASAVGEVRDGDAKLEKKQN
jgi:hypothetical protein